MNNSTHKIICYIKKLSESDDFYRDSLVFSIKILRYAKNLSISDHLLIFNNIPIGFERLCLGVIYLEIAKKANRYDLEILTLFALTNLSKETATEEDLREFFNSFEIYRSILSFEEIKSLKEISLRTSYENEFIDNYRWTFIKKANDIIMSYLTISRETNRKISSIFQLSINDFYTLEEKELASKRDLNEKNPNAVKEIYSAIGNINILVKSLNDKFDGLTSYLQKQAITEAEALKVTISDDVKFFEQRFEYLILNEKINSAWMLLQKFKSTVLLTQLTSEYGNFDNREDYNKLRKLGHSIYTHEKNGNAVAAFKDRMRLDSFLLRQSFLDKKIVDIHSEIEAKYKTTGVRSVLLEYVVTDRATYIFLHQAESKNIETIKINTGRAEIENNLKSLILGSSKFNFSKFDRFRENTEEVTNIDELKRLSILIDFIQQKAKPKSHLIIIPYGTLYFIPFHCLLLQDGEFLAQKYLVSYLPSVSFLGVIKKEKLNSYKNTHSLVVGSLYQDQNNDGFKKHLHAISEHISSKNNNIIHGTDANKKNIKHISNNIYWDVFYLSGHGIFFEKSPLDSGVLLSNGSSPPEYGNIQEDFIFSASDIINSNIEGDMAIIASCVSGRIKIHPGDELLGLVRSFFLRGFNTVVNSLWSFEMESGQVFMTEFIKRNKKLKQSRIMSFNQVQNDMIRGKFGKKYTHPYYWGTFQLIGEWS